MSAPSNGAEIESAVTSVLAKFPVSERDRRARILELIRSGKTDAEIARELYAGVGPELRRARDRVRTFRRRLMRELARKLPETKVAKLLGVTTGAVMREAPDAALRRLRGIDTYRRRDKSWHGLRRVPHECADLRRESAAEFDSPKGRVLTRSFDPREPRRMAQGDGPPPVETASTSAVTTPLKLTGASVRRRALEWSRDTSAQQPALRLTPAMVRRLSGLLAAFRRRPPEVDEIPAGSFENFMARPIRTERRKLPRPAETRALSSGARSLVLIAARITYQRLKEQQQRPAFPAPTETNQ